MTSKRKSILSIVTSVALAMILCLGIALPALAANYSEGTPDTPAKAAITKQLRVPTGTTVPTATFTFKFTAVGMDEGTDPAGMPGIPNVSVSFPDANAFSYEKNGDTYWVKETPDFIGGFTSADWTKGAGIYKYQAEELPSGITLTGAPNEGRYYSTAKYDIEIWVEEDTNGDLYAKFVAVKIVAGSEDEYYIIDGTPGTGKVDPTPGEEKREPGTDPEVIEDFSQVIFTNRYWASDGGGEENPDNTALKIEKFVAGNGAEKDKYFNFTVKVIQPDVVNTGTQTYMAYIIGADGNKTTDVKNYAGTFDSNGFIVFQSGYELKVNLKHDEKLAFIDLPVGAEVRAEEAADANYKPQYKRTFSDLTTFKADTANTAWGFPRNPGDTGPHCIGGGQNTNIATFINNRSGAAPTGISVDSLPYIILISLGSLAAAGFVVARVRRRLKNEA